MPIPSAILATKCPKEHPIKIPGKKRPAGTAVPYVITVSIYQKTKYASDTAMGSSV